MDIGQITKIWEIEPIELPAEQPVAPEPAVEPIPVEEPAEPEPVEETEPADDPGREPARTGRPGAAETKPLHPRTRI